MSRYDLVIIGGGTAGITAATVAAGAGARVLLAESDRTGGDCLWTGCVPSKTLIAAARRAHDMRTADRVGLPPIVPEVDLDRVMKRVREAIATVEPNDSPDHLRSLGVEVVLAPARFVAPGVVAVGDRHVRHRAALVATGSAPAVPPIDGIEAVPVLTSDTVWELRDLPDRLVVIGAGPVGCELGQAFARLGSQVTIVEQADRLLPGVDRDAAALVTDVLDREGVEVCTTARVRRIAGDRVVLDGPDGAARERGFDRLLVATGRVPRTTGLGLANVGVELDGGGAIRVDDSMRTSGRGILAAGDVTGGMAFTHVAATEAAVAVPNALFRLRRTVDHDQVPWAVFTDPEVAHVGRTEHWARDRWGRDAIVVRTDHAELDRAITAARRDGFTKLVADPDGTLFGATVVGESGGETIAELTAWLTQGVSLSDIAKAVHAYPTMAEGTWHAALAHLQDRLLSPRNRRITRPLLAVLRRLDVPR